jgi:hypothetical protein
MTNKNVLVICYSQTGQLTSVVKSITAPLEQSPDVEVTYEYLRPVTAYPFPWTFFRFLDTFPESVYLDPPPLQPLGVDPARDFDLIIIAYQVWFLSPSQPVTAFLQSDEGRRLLNGKPVITVVACRNMWLMAQEKVKHLLSEAGARLLDNVALVDAGNSLATFITTPRWLLTGKRGGDGLLPRAGIDERDVKDASRFGRALVQALREGQEKGRGPLLAGLKAAQVNEKLIASEKAGQRSFQVWGKLLRAVGRPGQARRRPFLVLYLIFLVSLIITVVPVTMAAKTLLHPLLKRRLAEQKRYFEQPSGSEGHRLQEFS